MFTKYMHKKVYDNIEWLLTCEDIAILAQFYSLLKP